ncbi:alpha/beta hydrolase [Spirosoma sp. KUDC1026]|uniref:alpha/beta hydrolase n=1 Tax=Spirosoma sp. KUDC1026 TaxID=2745947 RepID=UPI00159BEB10|nr:alpha/beta hydrolase [Spirosoma sp. KUDC1026]QKZ15067.1 alpha/beta hydrolase [Spirosoma sp. KUDC1026]
MTSKQRSWQGRLLLTLFRLVRLPKLALYTTRFPFYTRGDFRTPKRLNFQPETLAGVRCYWLNPAYCTNGVIIYLPGGGFVIGPQKRQWQLCNKLSRQLQYAVLFIPYNLAPDYPFPTALNAISNVIQELQHQQRLGSTSNWVVAGDNAGGNLCLSVTYALHAAGAQLPRKLVLLSPAVNLSQLCPDDQPVTDAVLSMAFAQYVSDAYIRQSDPLNPLLSPLYGDVNVLPLTLLLIGTQDILVHEARNFVQKMREAGKVIHLDEYPGMFHVFMLLAWLPEARRAFRSMVKFINENRDPIHPKQYGVVTMETALLIVVRRLT